VFQRKLCSIWHQCRWDFKTFERRNLSVNSEQEYLNLENVNCVHNLCAIITLCEHCPIFKNSLFHRISWTPAAVLKFKGFCMWRSWEESHGRSCMCVCGDLAFIAPPRELQRWVLNPTLTSTDSAPGNLRLGTLRVNLALIFNAPESPPTLQ
jgi:hypothetical protein